MIERPKMLFSIVERGSGRSLTQWLTSQDIRFHIQFVGTGTAPSDMLDILGLGSVDKQLMRKMAETTGGTFISINQAEDLADAMNTAATSYSERNLLSIRYMKHLNKLFGCLRVLFLSLIGLTIGGLLAFAYMDNASIPLILISSAISSVLGSILFELGIQTGVYQSILLFLLWILYASTLGYSYPENSILRSSHMRISSKRIQTSGYHIKKRQEY